MQSLNEQELKSDLNTTLTALPENREVVSAVIQLQKIASDNNIAISGFSASLSQENSSDFQIGISLKGDANSLRKMINQIKETPRVISVSAVDMAQQNSEEVATESAIDTKILASNLTVIVYYKAANIDLGDLSKPITPLTQKDKDLIASIKAKITKFFPSASSSGILSGLKGKEDPFQ